MTLLEPLDYPFGSSRTTGFSRGSSPTCFAAWTHGKSHGTGLGMAIAKSTVETHGGKISISSVEGKGTSVDIRLPALS
jgi:signal transduction histidine kinase